MTVRIAAFPAILIAATAGIAALAEAPVSSLPTATTTAPAAPVPAPPAGGRQGILLITIDSLRADHVGCYATDRPGVTPAIDLLAATGVRFERAYTASVSTAPSAASILTGVLPATHGLRDDLGGRLRSGVQTVADRLHAAGWATAASIGTDRLDSVRGLAAGFDRYDDEIKGLRKVVSGLSRERRAKEVADRGLVALDALPRDKPFFLWLHFHDPHQDYDPEEPQKSAYSASPYDGEVAAVDEAIGSAVRIVRDRVPSGRLLIVLAGTHGEGLGDQKEVGHGFYLNEATTRVPLVMVSGKPRSGIGRVVPGPVSLLDIAPTLLEFAGLPPVGGLAGVSQAAALADDGGAAGTGSGRARGRETPRRIYVEAAAPLAAYGWSPLFSVTDGSHRVVQGERLEAFDLAVDPRGLAPLPSAPRWTRDLAADGRAKFGSLDPPEARRRELDAAIATLAPPWEGSPLCASRDTHPDPRDPLQLELQDTLFFARIETEQGIVGRAWKRGEEVLLKDPANPTALETVIILAIRNHWSDQQVLDPLEILTCQYPYRPEGYHYLGHFYTNKRSWEQALKAFRLMGMVDPDSEEADYDTACAYAGLGKKDQAFDSLKRSIEKGSDDFDRIRRDGRLASLRDDPRFAALVPPTSQ